MGYKNPLRKMTSAVIWAVMFIFPVSVSSQSKPLKQIYVGVSSVSMGNIIIYVTKEAKLFEKYGLYADPVAMRGSGESSKAMIGGSIQVAPIATPRSLMPVFPVPILSSWRIPCPASFTR